MRVLEPPRSCPWGEWRHADGVAREGVLRNRPSPHAIVGSVAWYLHHGWTRAKDGDWRRHAVRRWGFVVYVAGCSRNVGEIRAQVRRCRRPAQHIDDGGQRCRQDPGQVGLALQPDGVRQLFHGRAELRVDAVPIASGIDAVPPVVFEEDAAQTVQAVGWALAVPAQALIGHASRDAVGSQ